MLIRAVIIDDEELGRKVLKKLIGAYCPQIEIIGEAGSVNEGKSLLQSTQPDLVFLDIQMPDGSGFSLLKQIPIVNFEIIFITSYDQFAIKAIKHSAIDYLLKPVETEDLKSAVEKAHALLLKKSSTPQVNIIVEQEILSSKAISLHTGSIVRLVKTSDIVHIEAASQYSNVYLQSGERINTTKTLKEFEVLLKLDSSFIRINRESIVNYTHLHSYSKSEPFVIKMNNGHSFEVSRRKKLEVMERLRKFKL